MRNTSFINIKLSFNTNFTKKIFILVREVYEETGYSIAEKIDPNMYITKTINDQECGLFLIPGVPMNTKFKPIAKFEIRDINWFSLDLLPSSKSDPIPLELHMTYNSLFMVSRDFKGQLISKYSFSNFSCMFLNPNNFFQFEF